MTDRRRLLALAAVVGMLALSGCTGLFGGGSVSEERLDRAPPGGSYAWNESLENDRDVHITVYGNATFGAVYAVNGSELTLFRRDGLGGRNPLDVRAVRYRYPNGTVITGSELRERGAVERTRNVVRIEFPGEGDVEGDRVAFAAGSTPKRFVLPTFIEGEYELVLPPNRRVSLPVFGDISPRPSETTVDEENRLHVVWTGERAVTSDAVVVQFYLPQDIRIFGIVAAILGTVAGGGLLYYRRQIERLRERREAYGLDVDYDDDLEDDGPPPGMR